MWAAPKGGGTIVAWSAPVFFTKAVVQLADKPVLRKTRVRKIEPMMTVSPPRPKSLPLTALRAFESAARLGGFSTAADELGVSPGAISAHIKTIEDSLGAALFTRTARGVALTTLGQRVLPGFTQAFDQMGDALQALRTEAAPSIVHIATLPAIAQFWLSPRLPELRAAAPEISISITAMESPPNLKRAPFDLCLFYGTHTGEWLADDVVFPVCAPSLSARLATPENLRSVPCLTDTSWVGDWDSWAKTAMPSIAFAPRGPVFSLYALAVEETINGAGVLMGHQALIAPHLAAGMLVAPFETKVRLNRSLRMWSLRTLRRSSPAGQVAEWLKKSG
jgi:LysR family glycine cleavage system transcriptional activator